MLHSRSHGLDALALHQNLAGLEHVSGIDLKQARGVQDDGRGGWLLRIGDCYGKNTQNKQAGNVSAP
jgi:hypothetical protein